MVGRHLPCQTHIAQQTANVSTLRSAHINSGSARRCSSSDGTSTSGRFQLHEHRPESTRRHGQVQSRCSVIAPGREQEAPQLQEPTPDHYSSSGLQANPLLCDPDSFTVAAGELSPVNQEASQRPQDVFRCSGCSLEECQVTGECVTCATLLHFMLIPSYVALCC